MTTRGHHGLLLQQTAAPSSAPIFISTGTPAVGQAAINVAWPTHATGDLGLLLVETSNEAPAALSGWTQLAQLGTGTPGAGGAVMLTIYGRIAASSSEGAVNVPDSGNHNIGVIMVFRGANASSPVDVSATGSGSGASITLPSVTTTGADRLVVCAVGDSWDNNSTARYSDWTHAGIASITERLDAGTTNGNGGGFGAATGERSIAGSTGTGSVTFANGLNNWVAITIALKA